MSAPATAKFPVGLTLIYRGIPITYCDERGRRFWTACVPDPSGWRLTQEFCSREDAERYVDERLPAFARAMSAQREEGE